MLFLFFLIIKNQYLLSLLNIYCNHLWQIESIQLMTHLTRLHFANHVSFIVISPFSALLSENSSRNWRYTAFNRLSCFSSSEYLIVGHTKTDQIESLFLNLCRGTGFFGLTTLKNERINDFCQFICFTEKKSSFYQHHISSNTQINAKTNGLGIQLRCNAKTNGLGIQLRCNATWSLIWRPLFLFNRFELYRLYTLLNLPIWTDQTNFQFKYRRNRIRFELLPYLRFYLNPNVDFALSRFIQNIDSEGLFLQKLTLKTFKNSYFLGKKKKLIIHNQSQFLKYPYHIQKQIILTSLVELKQSQIDYKLVQTLIKYIYLLKDKRRQKHPFILLSNCIMLGFSSNNIILCCINESQC